MDENNEKELDLEPEPPEPVLGDDDQDTFDWKASDLKHYGMAKRFKTKNEKLNQEFEDYKKTHPDVKEPEKQPQDKKEFDLAEQSYLLAKGIKENQFQMVFDEVKASGKTIKEVLESPYFKEKLEVAASEAATPSAAKRAGGSAKDQADYWIKKGEYPPNTPENRALRRQVAAALVERAKDGNKFSPSPIV
jgi:hypothetical protein